ncbi:hypothetical protein DMB42_45830 [Nonomuraea sp. WAC 01424]|uniref:hypothetical protein n=1 Tax=Nonomuraea sp. WAC 01424 TaxID=2203200 RepID=UPI000F7B0F84|nr:hypothetical protein [Nonomuraea sp. WAC 01424]RSM97570.1 hypothetical protein DMB42_45830 [Nonomuraea sp. WAC 01424]
MALAGGVALLLGLNGTFAGPPSGAPAGGNAAAAARQAPAGESQVQANPSQAPEAGKGAPEARELRKGEARPSTSPATRPDSSGTPTTQGAGDPAPKQDTVSGQTETGDAQVSVADPGDPATQQDPASQQDPATQRDPAGHKGSAGYKADGPSRHTDEQAAEYFNNRWGAGDKAMKHVKDIRTVGGYLRIYTNLPDTADNSPTAIKLCKRGLEYLRANGVKRPIVFVQAEFGENGNPVLANILGPSDTNCRVTYPRPK